ncbi:hypothetical protein [Paenibacillus sp. J2TS4]|uniref:hypothetical protein n=1 Tax=Paenibacillus sp. J2TS4 TaxID=2807194 RepID=UPI001B2B55EC|nr:hypothetical protein [Paenibacillus sp. J2TS4]GIP34114.1 hypothetical protein J2TS4_33240 [Paenibacillus sp. J2TS4]
MPRTIQAYFRTEDDAESARTKLQTYAVTDMEVGELQDKLSEDVRLLTPFVAGAAGADGSLMGSGAGVTGSDRGVPVVVAMDVWDRDSDEASDSGADDLSLDDFTYVLSCQVEDEDYDELIDVIRRNGGSVKVFQA